MEGSVSKRPAEARSTGPGSSVKSRNDLTGTHHDRCHHRRRHHRRRHPRQRRSALRSL